MTPGVKNNWVLQQSATAVLIEAGAPFDAAAIYTNF
jgi:hypothetical protein